MSRLIWDADGSRLYETGIDRGVLYQKSSTGSYPSGVAWNGLTAITESPSGAEANPIYADNIKYLNLYSAEEFGATVEAYTYPDEFAECDGSAEAEEGVFIGQQERKAFGICYRTKLGNDTEGDAHGYKIHIIYGAKASPSERQYQTVNDSPEAIAMSWELTTTPTNVTGMKPTSNLIIDSTKCDSTALKTLEAILYGCDEFAATKTYTVGDVASHETKTYKCVTAITTPAAWDASKWEQISTVVGPQLPLPDAIIAMFAE